MKLKQDTLNEIAGKFVDAGVTERHVERERSLYTDVYGIDPERPEEDVQMLFDIAIQNRAWSLSPSEYRALSEDFDPGEFLSCNSREDAFNNIREIDDLARKSPTNCSGRLSMYSKSTRVGRKISTSRSIPT